MKRLVPIFLVPVVLAILLFARRSAPPEIPFAKAARETIVSTLNTNGKVEPYEWQSVRSERDGVVDRIHVQRGQKVAQGQLMVELDSSAARSELAAAEARVAQAGAELDVVEAGGRVSERVEIENSLARAHADLAIARREHESLLRLQRKNAATTAQVRDAADTVDRLQQQIQALSRRLSSLVSQPDKSAAQARIREFQAAASGARDRIARGQIRSPLSGVLYQFDLKTGAYLNPGDLVGLVGKLDRVRVNVYVDEPELGRVAAGMPVRITWDALPGREWTGVVEKVPTQVVTLNTRQVGEVTCVIENPDQTLIPGTNINAEIRSRVIENALTIPKEALRRQGSQAGVFKLAGERIQWQPVETGASSITRIQITSGLNAGDSISLPVERVLKSGDKIVPVYP